MLPERIARLLTSIRQALPARASAESDPRIPDLDALAATHDARAVPDLLPLLVANDALRPHVARTIAALSANVSPSQLSWLDSQARRFHSVAFDDRDWFALQPSGVVDLCRSIRPHWAAMGILASHPNGFVREIALRELGRSTGGVEIPYLTIRANDWVGEVAEIAAGLLAARLVPSNRAVVVAALPFIVRMFDQRRQDHRHLAEAFITVLGSDDLRDVLQAIRTGERRVARRIYELLLDRAPSRQIIDAAISDVDPVVRRLVIRRLPSVGDANLQTGLLVTLAVGDRSPGVRKDALALLAERDANRVRSILRGALLDRSARVRSLARFLAAKLDPSIDVRALYLEQLDATSDRSSAAAIDGLGEVGTRDDADRLVPLLTVERSRIRRAALRALAQCDRDRALPAAMSALEDPSGSVRTAAGAIVRAERHRVDFATLHGRWRQGSDPNVRLGMLVLLAHAPKWDAVVYLLDALVTDSSEAMHRHAARLLNDWIAAFNRSQLQPSREHLQRIRAVLAAPTASLDPQAATFLRFVVEER